MSKCIIFCSVGLVVDKLAVHCRDVSLTESQNGPKSDTRSPEPCIINKYEAGRRL